MGSIVTAGVGSGLDVTSLVKQLVQAEGGPKTLRLNAEEAKVQAKLSALGTLRSALATFRGTVTTLKNIDKFQGRQASLSTLDFVKVSAKSSAVPGSYEIEVQQLATTHKLQSSGATATAATVVGTGTLHFEIDEQQFDVVIDAESNTLAGIAAAINDSAVGAKVLATVITGSGEARLTLSARASGADNEMTVTQNGGDAGLVALVAGLAPLQDALDAKVLIDGVPVTSSTNTVSGAVAGVEIALIKANDVGVTTEVTVGYDRAAARKTIDDFVKSYNAVVDAIKSVSGYNVETREGGPLFGDAGVRNIVFQLRRELTANVTGLSASFDMLGEIGITADLNGKLSVDSADLDAAFTADFDGIGELFATEDVGLAVKLDKLLAPYLDSAGVFDSRTAGLKSSIDVLSERREELNTRLVALHARYTKQFNALDSLLSQLQGTSNFLNQQLSKLPGFTSQSGKG
ncbi:MAG TPA: flagellar filament capping protein FliD [Gammaproteobacteria bacterium]|nr:flagellar filament capping protein FliD [Gammaproteobacteria bacterium]